jgi:RNA12 protein
VSERLGTQGAPASLRNSEKINLEKLGGRSSDLQTASFHLCTSGPFDLIRLQLIHKVRSGMTIEEAVDDIIMRGVGELRKNAFGEESEDAKSMAWLREQVFFILKGLAKSDEVRGILPLPVLY